MQEIENRASARRELTITNDVVTFFHNVLCKPCWFGTANEHGDPPPEIHPEPEDGYGVAVYSSLRGCRRGVVK